MYFFNYFNSINAYIHPHLYASFIIKKRRDFIFYFIPKCIEINGIYVRRCTKWFGFKTLFAPICKSSWSLPFLITSLSMQALTNSNSSGNLFYLEALECSQSWCGYTVHSTLTGYVAGHQVRAFHFWAYHFLMSPEWTTASRLTTAWIEGGSVFTSGFGLSSSM